MFNLKRCIFCKRNLPIGHFNKNKRPDIRWDWCKECEKKASYYDVKKGYSNVISFSGGKDSTAMLLLMIEHKIKFDAVVYFDCGTWEFPQMAEHIKKVESYIGIKILTIKPKIDFTEQMISTPNTFKKQINGWPIPSMRWCTMQKINIIRKHMRVFRPYYMYIGYTTDELKRVNKADAFGHNLLKTRQQVNKFPLIDFKMSETDCLKYCTDRGFDWGGLYNHFKRVSCWCCPLQGKKDLTILCKHYPELWQRLKQMNQALQKFDIPNKNFKNDIGIFKEIEHSIDNHQ